MYEKLLFSQNPNLLSYKHFWFVWEKLFNFCSYSLLLLLVDDISMAYYQWKIVCKVFCLFFFWLSDLCH